MYTINTKKALLQLEIVPVASLLQHEQIIPEKARRLIFEFRNLASLQNPVIVDKNHVVLDGNHRNHVFNILRFKYIPVCKIDYLQPATKLRCWFRLLENIHHFAIVLDVFKAAGCHLVEMSDRSALIKALDANQWSCGIQRENHFILITFPQNIARDPVAVYDLLQSIQIKLESHSISLDYIPCNTIRNEDYCEVLAPENAIVWTPRITKETVVDCAKQNKIFAPKTTRHVIPARPLNVNVPGHWLKENIPLKEMRSRFEEFLNTKKVRRFGPGQVIDGRYYEEELYVFFSATRKGFS